MMRETQTAQSFRQKELVIFSTIPGMKELLHAAPEDIHRMEARYPDAAFALHTANTLFDHNRELSLITQHAYFSILNGENISSVRFRYQKETDAYWKDHMWDD